MNNTNNSLGRWISLLYRFGKIYIGRKLEPQCIRNSQYIFLNALYKQDGINQDEISEYLKIDKGTTAKAIKQLEKDGYVIRQEDTKDKRKKKVFLTEKAQKVKPAIRSALVSWNDGLWKGFTAEERVYTLKMIERIANNAILLIDRDNNI